MNECYEKNQKNQIPENFLYNNFFKKIDIDKIADTNEIINKISNNETLKKQDFEEYLNNLNII